MNDTQEHIRPAPQKNYTCRMISKGKKEPTNLLKNINVPIVKMKPKNALTKLITFSGDTPITNSLIVAKKFSKRHDNVISKIENLIVADKVGLLNFKETSRMDSWNRSQKIYLIDKKSFTVLAMRFTGDEALEWQIKFVEAFEKMERILLHQQNISWQQARIDGKQKRIELTDAIKQLVVLAKKNGSRNANKYYITITKMVYKQVFDIKRVPNLFRETLSKSELYQLQLVEWKLAEWLNDAIDSCQDYHEPYQEIKMKLKSLITVIGCIDLNRQIAA